MARVRTSGLAVVLLGALMGCAAEVPLTLPAADGREAVIVIGDGYRYVVNYQSSQQARGGVFLRITRASAPELTYSDGLTAKKVAEAYCDGYNRALNPVAFGQFSLPASWMFEGGCT